MACFVEESCTISHEGRTFEAGGAWLCDCTDGYRRGVVYAKVTNESPSGVGYSWGVVTDWHGNQIAKAEFKPTYQGNFCRMRSLSFVVDGVKFSGRWCPDWADAVRVRSTRKVA